jgi:hypothetical protein
MITPEQVDDFKQDVTTNVDNKTTRASIKRVKIGGFYRTLADWFLQLATVARTGDYADLINKPDIPGTAPVQSVNGRTGNVIGLAEQVDLQSEIDRATAAEALKADKTYVDSQDSALQVNIDIEESERESADNILSLEISQKAGIDSITSTLQIDYSLLNVGKQTYTNTAYANKSVHLFDMVSGAPPVLYTFNSSGVLDLGYVADPAFVGLLLGTLGIAAGGLDDYLQGAETINQLEILDANGLITYGVLADNTSWPFKQPLKIDTNGLSATVQSNLLKDDGISYLASSVIDSNGNILSALYVDSTVWPFAKPVSSSSSSNSTFFDDTYDYLQGPEVIDNAIYGQWGYPIAAYDGECLYIGSVGRGKGTRQGEIGITQKRDEGLIRYKILGNVRLGGDDDKTDDHNVPVVRYDDRDGAATPLMVFQTEHNTNPTRIWKQPSKNIDKFITTSTNFANNCSYNQVLTPSTNKNEILVFSREDSAIPRTWRLAYSSDNGVTFNSKSFFAGDGWMYMLAKMSDDSTKANIVFYAHPDNSTDHRIFMMILDFASGAIYAPGSSGSPIIADFRASMSNGSYVAVDPRIGAKVLVANGASTNRTRLCGIGTESSGECLMSYVQFEDLDPAINAATYYDGSLFTSIMNNYRNSKHRVCSFNLATGIINYDIEVGSAGMPIDRRTDARRSYYMLNEVLDAKTVITAIYKNQSYIDGGNDISGNDGFSEIIKVDLTDHTNPVYTSVYKTMSKSGRPVYVKSANKLLIIEASKYLTFNDFKSQIRILNLNNF